MIESKVVFLAGGSAAVSRASRVHCDTTYIVHTLPSTDRRPITATIQYTVSKFN